MDAVVSVSYTHLDVYKRQGQFRGGGLPVVNSGGSLDDGLHETFHLIN